MQTQKMNLRPAAPLSRQTAAPKRTVQVRAAETDETPERRQPFAAMHTREPDSRYRIAVNLVTHTPTGEDDEHGKPIYAEYSEDETHRRAKRLVAKWDARDAEERAFRDRMIEARVGFMAEHGDRLRQTGRTKPTRLEVSHYMTGEYDPKDFGPNGWTIRR